MRTPPNQGPRISGVATRIAGPMLALGLTAVIGLGTATPAAAGDVKGKISYGQRQVDRHHERGFNVSIRFGDRDRGHRYERGHRHAESGHHRGIDHARCGYYKQVWSPPRYAYRYDACGRRYRVLVKRGCYERVWVAQCNCNQRRAAVCR